MTPRPTVDEWGIYDQQAGGRTVHRLAAAPASGGGALGHRRPRPAAPARRPSTVARRPAPVASTGPAGPWNHLSCGFCQSGRSPRCRNCAHWPARNRRPCHDRWLSSGRISSDAARSSRSKGDLMPAAAPRCSPPDHRRLSRTRLPRRRRAAVAAALRRSQAGAADPARCGRQPVSVHSPSVATHLALATAFAMLLARRSRQDPGRLILAELVARGGRTRAHPDAGGPAHGVAVDGHRRGGGGPGGSRPCRDAGRGAPGVARWWCRPSTSSSGRRQGGGGSWSRWTC